MIWLYTRKLFFASAILCVFGSAEYVFPISTAVASTSLEKKQQQLEELSKKAEAYKNIIELKQTQAGTLGAQITSLEARSNRLENAIANNQQKLHELSSKIQIIEDRLHMESEILEAKRTILSGLLQSYYDWDTQEHFSSFMLGSSGDLLLGTPDQIRFVSEKVTDILEDILALQKKLENDRSALSSNKEDLETTHQQLQNQNDYLDNAKQVKTSLLEQTNVEQKVYEKKLDSVEEQRKQIEQEIEDIESSKSGELDLKSMPPAKKGELRYPVQSPITISQRYGKAKWTKWYSFHNGVDFSGKTGMPIFSAAKGRVVAIGDSKRYAYGKWIAIDHGNGITTLYGHLSKHGVKKGDTVSEGEIIGLMGSTGYSTGPHLHFTVFSSKTFEVVASKSVSGINIPTGAHVNPMKYLE